VVDAAAVAGWDQASTLNADGRAGEEDVTAADGGGRLIESTTSLVCFTRDELILLITFMLYMWKMSFYRTASVGRNVSRNHCCCFAVNALP